MQPVMLSSPRIAEMTQSCKPETLESGYDNMEHYTVDFNAEERVLYQLDFIKGEEGHLANVYLANQ